MHLIAGISLINLEEMSFKLSGLKNGKSCIQVNMNDINCYLLISLDLSKVLHVHQAIVITDNHTFSTLAIDIILFFRSLCQLMGQ